MMRSDAFNKNYFHVFLLILFLISCSPYTYNKDAEYTPAEEMPQDIKPVSISKIILGAGDTISVYFWRQQDLSGEVKIDPNGNINYPLVGEIRAAGSDVIELQEKLRMRFEEYYSDPKITVSLITITSQKVFILGEVKNPGVFNFDSYAKILEFISQAGGFTQNAVSENIFVIRGDKTDPDLIKCDIKRALQNADLSQNIVLNNGDIVFVPSMKIASVAQFSNYLAMIISPISLLFQSGAVVIY